MSPTIGIDSLCARWLPVVLDLPTAERTAFIERECGHDAALCTRLHTLLELDRGADGWLDQPLDALCAELLAGDADAQDRGTHDAQSRIGPYRLVHEIGRGGMGSVWLAERADGEFQQQVALKLIKLGMDSAHVQSQFRRERALLARLQHPNIAQLIDGGVDERGRPWFAMELVEGVGLRAWIEQRQPGLRQRLRLFVKLCRAVAHAHQQLVVHRDLKPSNVLVQGDDEPRLLDFGIAKLVENDEPEQTVTVQRFLSRDYAAPEQLRGDAISTATDVYALGLILFELLTGQRYRALRKEGGATLRPSAALAGAIAGPTDISRAKLRGDLDAITLRALADDPPRRYAGAQALADDAQRHLDGRPVEARPDGLAYRAAKFVRRNVVPVGIAALGAAALLVASGVAFWQAHAKAFEADRARTALRQSETTRDFMASVFLAADPSRARGAATTAGELLAVARERVARDLAGEPAIAADLLDQIGNTYVSLGEDESARGALREALAFNARAPRPSVLLDASAAGRLAHYEFIDGHSDVALAEFARIVDRLRAQGAGAEALLAKTLQLRGHVLFSTGQTDAALVALAQAAEVLSPRAGEWVAEYVGALASYADAAAGVGQGAQALEAAERALAQLAVSNLDAPALKVSALGAKVRALQALQRDTDAEPLLAEVIAGQSALYSANASRTRYWHYRHAQLLQKLGRLDQAQDIIDRLIDQPADDTEQPAAAIAHRVTGASIALARNTPDAPRRAAAAEALACGGQANPRFCEKARELRAKH